MNNTNIKSKYNNVIFSKQKIKSLSFKSLASLKKITDKNFLKRARICFHKNINDSFQEMFICIKNKSFINPSYHNYNETITIINGKCFFTFFNASGLTKYKFEMGNFNSKKPFLINVPPYHYHNLTVTSVHLFIFENLYSAFSKNNTFFSKWKKNTKNHNLRKLDNKHINFNIIKINENNYFIDQKLFYLDYKNINFLINKLNNKLNFINLFFNTIDKSINKKIVFLHNSFANNSYQLIKKEMSICVIHGKLEVFIKNNLQQYKKIYLSNRNYKDYNKSYIRLRKNFFYKLKITSNYLIMQTNKLI